MSTILIELMNGFLRTIIALALIPIVLITLVLSYMVGTSALSVEWLSGLLRLAVDQVNPRNDGKITQSLSQDS